MSVLVEERVYSYFKSLIVEAVNLGLEGIFFTMSLFLVETVIFIARYVFFVEKVIFTGRYVFLESVTTLDCICFC